MSDPPVRVFVLVSRLIGSQGAGAPSITVHRYESEINHQHSVALALLRETSLFYFATFAFKAVALVSFYTHPPITAASATAAPTP